MATRTSPSLTRSTRSRTWLFSAGPWRRRRRWGSVRHHPLQRPGGRRNRHQPLRQTQRHGKTLRHVRHFKRVRQTRRGVRRPDEPGALECHHGPRGELPPDHPHGGGDDPAHRLPKLKVLYDVYHMQLNEGSLCDNIRAYGDQFGHIHVADAPGPAPGRSTTPMCLPVWRKPDTPA